MTQSIDREQRERALRARAAEPVDRRRRARLVVGIWIFTGAALLAGGCLTAVHLATGGSGISLALAAATSFVLAGLGGSVLCVRALLAGRQEFYQRGQLDGWMRGWRGQEPEVGDPLLR